MPPNTHDRPAGLFGPQYQGDSCFAARMRFHQSWYRACKGLPYGTGPTSASESRYGNMLTEKDGEDGRNFLTPAIFGVAMERLGEGRGVTERHRLLCNMLSSQPMCFNLFGPLCRDTDLATRLFQALLAAQIAQVRNVRLEFAPTPKKGYLNDNTAFDAFVEYEAPDDGPGFVGIETKLIEPFSQYRYRKDEYREWTARAGSPWPLESWPQLDKMAHNQLWRDHMLVEALREHRCSSFTAGRLLLVRHPGDTKCAQVVEGYRALVRPDDHSFLDLPLDQLVDAWSSVVLDGPERDWLDAFRLRYLDLHASEEAWQQYRAGPR